MTLLEMASEPAVRRAGLRDMAEQALEAWGLAGAGLRLLEEKKNVTWRVDAHGERFLLRLCRPDGYTPGEIASEAAWLRALRRQEGLVVPEPLAAGDGAFVVRCQADGLEPRSCILFRWVEGETLDASISPAMMERVGEVVARLHAFNGRFVPPSGFRRPRHDSDRMFGGSEVLPPGRGEELVPRSGRDLLDEAARRVRERIEALGTGPEVFGMIHTDPEPDNMVCRDGEVYPIDFADCGWGYYLYDLAASLLPLGQKKDFPALREAFLRGYRRRRELRPEHEALLDTFLIARGLFAVRWMLVHGWETPKVRAYAAQVVPHILGEVRRYLQTGLSTVQLLSRLRARGVQLAAEGDRLRLRAPKGALTPELQAELAERKSEVLAFLRRGSLASEAPPIPRVPRVLGHGLPLSFSQSQIWFLDQFDPGTPAYNIPQSVHLEGDVRLDLLEKSLNEVVRRHEILRTTFGSAEGEPVQIVARSLTLLMPLVDLGGIPAAAREAEVVRLSREEARRPFDLAAGPLLRLTALRLTRVDHRMLVTTHHIVSDGWSGGVFVRELATTYAALAQGRPSPLPELPIQFGDYAAWQRVWLRGEVLERQLAYWRQKLAGAPAVLDLPSDRPRTRYQTRHGGRLDLLLPPELSQRLRGLAQRSGATLFMTLLAGFDALVFRYTGREDVVVGSPIANRNRTETEGLIGFFVNTLVLRTTFDGGAGFRELLAKVKETTVEAFSHQDLTFEKLVEELRPERSLTYTPLFQVIFNFQNAPLPSLRLEGLTLTWVSAPTGTEKFDLNIAVREAPEGIHLVLRYKRDLFDPPTIARLAEHSRALLEAVTADPERPLAELPYLGEAERALLLREWNDTSAPVEEGAFPERFARQAARTPGATAVVFAGQALSYGELDRRANQLARRLRRLGVGWGSLVGICLERSVEMVIAIFGVLKSGAAYVPLDPEYPAERLAFLVRDAGVRVLVTRSRWMEVLPSEGVAAVRLDAIDLEAEEASDPRIGVGADDLAYVIYTSGTTGEPKGTMIRHGAMANYASALRAAVYGDRRLPLRVSLNARITFDASVKQLSHLLWGDCLEIVPDAVRLDAEALVAFARERLDVLDCSPSQLKLLLRSGLLVDGTRPSVVLIGGEAIDETTWRELVACSGTRFYNHYGPTECTVNVTICRVSGDRPRLGRPVANASVYMLDPGQQLVPVGVPGELCVGGAGLGQGYLGRPRQTAEKFIPDPFGGEPGARLYRSGDLARLLPTGEIEFLGRIDHQVKLRGFRIEPGEIETVLRAHPAVREAVVLLRDDSEDPEAAFPGERRLVAYVVARPEEEPPAVPELRALLRSKLPDYMMPAAFVVLERLPLTANGKVDRRALPAPVRDHAPSVPAWSAPRTPTEERLAGVWAEVLGLVRVGREDHFFELGGHSLLAARVTARLREAFGIELPLRELFENPTVAGLALAVDRERCRASAPPPPLVPVSREGELPLSYGQQRLWFLDQLASGSSTAYHIPGALRLQGRLDPGLLRRVLAEIVGRHEVLRTVFPAVTGQPVQTILPELALPLPIVDLSALPEQSRGTAARCLAEEEALRPFDLSSGPLIRGMLLRVASEDHVALLTLHHIVADGWSRGILFQELAALYQAFSRGGASPLPELPLQYADFAAWQRRWLAGETLEAEVGWWRRQLDGAPPSFDLPTDKPRPPVQTFRGRALPVALPMNVSAAVASLARSQRATSFMVLLAAFQVLLGRCSGQNDVVVGTPVAGRAHREVEGLIGFFVNTLALRGKLDWGHGFLDHLRRVRGTAMDAYLHQALPFEHLVEALRPERDLSRNPLFQVAFTLQNLPRTDLELPGLRISRVRHESTTAKFDLGLTLQETPEGISGWLEYGTDLFDLATADRLARCFRNLLEGIAADPDERAGDLPLLGPGELRQIVGEWSVGASRPPLPDVGLHELFERRVREEPEAVAVVFGGSSLTYDALDARAEALAGTLRALGVGPETLVGICAEEGMERVVGVLGVFKAGGAYLPLDPSNPVERLSFMIEDSGIAVILTQERLLGILPGSRAKVLLFEELPTAPAGPGWEKGGLGGEALAYVIYTSGSTGRPNGVLVRHRSAVGLILEAIERLQVGPGSRVLQSVSFSFDASVLETWIALASGAALCIAGREARISGEALAELIRSEGITTAVLTPAILASLRPVEVSPLRVVAVGGDRCPGELASRWAPPASPLRILLNCYGPTETTIYTTVHLCAGSYRKEPPIGRPVPGSRAHVLDPRCRPLPEGMPGELFIAGEGLARGYLNRPALTAQRFVPDPFSTEPGSRLYRTGDQVRWLADGSLEFLGRVDLQVKIRGLRIEPGEIEAVLGRHPKVSDCAVAVHQLEGEPRLVAWVVPAADGNLSAELRRHLRERLPDYMVPSDLVFLSSLPLTPTGKVDRRALPDPEAGETDDHLPARDELELEIARIWEELLRRPVGVRDDFFELGGHSLLAVQLLARIRARLGHRIPLSELFRGTTVERMAALLRADGAQLRRSTMVELQPGDGEAPLFLVHPVGGNVFCYLELARHLGGPVYGLQASAGGESLEAMAARYVESVRGVQPEGPYRLAGWSLGGAVAFEMARQLAQGGERVDLLALIDPSVPASGEPRPEPDEETLARLFARDLEGLHGLESRELFEVFRHNIRALRAWRPRPHSGTAVLFRAAERLPGETSDPVARWSGLVTGRLEVEEVEGDHYSLLRGPRARALAERLRERLERGWS